MLDRYLDRQWHPIVLHGVTFKDGEARCTCSKGSKCRTPGKHPVARAWGTQPLPETIPDGRNVGIATGDASGFVVLDVDGPEGLRSLDALEDSYGPLPVGPRQTTGSGGLHILFLAPANALGNRVKVRPGLDVRANGAQIVAAPSMHASGARYRWDGFDLDLPPLPDWLLEIMTSGKSEASAFDVCEWLDAQPPCVEGDNGSAQLMRVAAKLARTGVSDAGEFLEIVDPYNERCEPPWSEYELAHAWDNAFKRAMTEGKAKLRLDSKGNPENSLMSLRTILATDLMYAGTIRRNLMGDFAEHQGERVDDDMILTIRGGVLERYGWRDMTSTKMLEAVRETAAKNSYSPVAEYLHGLKWDETPRLNTVAKQVLGASGELAATMARKWMVSAVARGLAPGCDVQNVMVLAGEQGLGKSSFFRILGDPWFMDTPIDITNKDSYQQLNTTWICEWAELDSLYRAREQTAVKAFLSARSDTYRKSHDRITKAVPRCCVFGGSTNRYDFLADPTGSRRWWVLDCQGTVDNGRKDAQGIPILEADLEWLKDHKHQLWAEAVVAFKAGESWRLPPELEQTRAEESEAYQAERPLYDKARECIQRGDVTLTPEGYIRLEKLAEALMFDHVRMPVQDRTQLTQALKDEGFVARKRQSGGARIRVFVPREARGPAQAH